MNKKTILYLITQQEFGGAGHYVFDLAANLKKNFNVFVGFQKSNTEKEFSQKLEKEGIKFFEIKHLKREISPLNDFLALLEIRKIIKDTQADIIHLNSSKISILGAMAALGFKRSKVIYTVHGWVFNEPSSKLKNLFYRSAEKLTAITKDKLICVSDYDRQTAINNNICPPNKLVTIHNGLAPTSFINTSEAFKILRVKPEKNQIIIGSIGNLYKTKGFEHLIRAAKILKDRNINFKLVIIGEGEERRNLYDLIQSLGLVNEVILFGNLDNAKTILKAFDIYVSSSVKEGLPYSIIEAMQAELPIVATKVGGNQELIENKKSGLLVKEEDENSLANAVTTLCNNGTLRQQLSEGAKEKAMKEFSLENMIDATKKIY